MRKFDPLTWVFLAASSGYLVMSWYRIFTGGDAMAPAALSISCSVFAYAHRIKRGI